MVIKHFSPTELFFFQINNFYHTLTKNLNLNVECGLAVFVFEGQRVFSSITQTSPADCERREVVDVLSGGSIYVR